MFYVTLTIYKMYRKFLEHPSMGWSSADPLTAEKDSDHSAVRDCGYEIVAESMAELSKVNQGFRELSSS